MNNKILIAITTFNRKNLIEITQKSLSEIDNINYNDIYIFDDCSTEFDANYLRKKYPGAHIIKSKKNLGADKNIERAYKYFLKSSYDYFFNADSDLLFKKDLLNQLNNIINKMKKNKPILFSVFNTNNHKTIGEYSEDFLIKKDVGACGCIFNKKAIKLFINKLPETYKDTNTTVDYVFCQIYRKLGHRILVTKNSLVQHIGTKGQNSNELLFDWGIGFVVDSITNAKAIISIYEENITLNAYGAEEKVLDYIKKGKFGISLALKILIIAMKNKIKKIGDRNAKRNKE